MCDIMMRDGSISVVSLYWWVSEEVVMQEEQDFDSAGALVVIGAFAVVTVASRLVVCEIVPDIASVCVFACVFAVCVVYVCGL